MCVSPDGLIADDGVIEIKFLLSVTEILKVAVGSNGCYKVVNDEII